ncbi:flagellar hook protein FlgE [Rhabdaerophilum calidifontis]|uniref:flagellar hook protein FlgE n=1 Tax=Rhabdaerophilum calidifontis TaxID=2604328 RepID=UPI00123BD3F5|nr:flagellar hook protein FlgE [Rhabdaerophilum calidifontis]
MGIFGAMTTAISGLNAQSFALENISGNIANSRTTGFKRVDTSFADLIPDLPPRREISGSVGAFSRNTATIAGDVQGSQIATNMAVSGQGFFIVKQQSGGASGQPVFTGQNYYTRRGDFDLDRNGYLTNGTGYYLMGYPVNASTGAVSGALQVLRVSSDNLPARATTSIDYNANLPKYPLTANADPAVAGSELLTGALYTGATIAAVDEQGFLNRTIAGQTVTVYDAAGSPITLQMRWGKTTNAAPETWSLYYLSDSNAVGAAPKWTRVSNTVQFNASGQMTSPASGVITGTYTVNGVTSGTIDLNFGTSGLTQFADPNGQETPNFIGQNGYPTGSLQSVRATDGGLITGTYSNGQTVTLAQVPLAQFPADNLLKRNDGGVFEETLESGQALITAGGSNIVGSSTEASNADIADEFSKMIVTQQAYSANTRVVTTAQQMLQDVINIIR